MPVTAQRIEPADMTMPEQKVKEINTVEQSMRLDAIASAAFGIARDKMVERIKAGAVRVNWNDVKKPNLSLEEGDVIACKGKGRAEIKKVNMTKKMKYAISLTKYS